MRFRSLAALGVAISILGTAACTDNSGPNGQVAGGLYALTSVNGVQLPYTYSTGGASTVTLQSDVYTLNSNGTYTEVINESVYNGFTTSPTTDNESGTWSQAGNTVTFQPSYSSFNPNLQAYQASVQSGGIFGSDALVMNSGSGQMVYQHE